MAKASPNNGNESEAEPSKPEEIRDHLLGRNGGKWLLKEEKKDMKGALKEKLRARAINDEGKSNTSLGQPVPKALSFGFLTIAHHLLCILYEQVCVCVLHEQVCVQSAVV